MRRVVNLVASLLLLLVWVALPAGAAEPLESKLVASKVMVDKKGRETFKSAAKAGPGDVIEYKVTYKNKGKVPLSNITAKLPIPVGMVYVADSAFSEEVQASTNGQDYAPVPLLREKATGKLVQREHSSPRTGEEAVPLMEYRFLQWRFAKLPPKASQIVRARAAVIAPAP